MGAGIQPVPPTPEEWRLYMLNAKAALHENPQDAEALQAIRDAAAALNMPEEEAMAAGENVGESGYGKIGPAFKGLGEAAVDVPVGMFQLAKGLLTHPGQTLAHDLPQSFIDIGKGFASGDPERIARSTGNVGAMLLPGAEIVRGGPTLGALGGRAALALPRALREVATRPGKLNRLTEAQTARAQAGRAALESRTAQQASMHSTKMSQMASRLQALEQIAARGPATAENLMLRNEILRLRLEMMQEGGAVGGGEPMGEPMPEQGPFRGTAARPIGEETPPFEESAASDLNQQAMIRKIAQHMLEQSRQGRLPNRQFPLLPPGE